MTAVSLVIVSRDRPALLARLLRSLKFQSLPAFEVIVVAPDPLNQAGLRHVPFAEQNISSARNAGIAAASGEIIAFCDDDAVPEPPWLERLAAAFADPAVGAAGGSVLRRNGIDRQFSGCFIDETGSETGVLPSAGTHAPANGLALVTIGTNCAFRRQALNAVGGFDAAYRYFLDEADLTWRLARAGWHMAFLPEAVVHHDFAGNAVRDGRRTPRDYSEIAASRLIFVRKHAPDRVDEAADSFRRLMRRQAAEAFSLGLVDGRTMRALEASVDRGLTDGRVRPFGQYPAAIGTAEPDFLPFPGSSGPRIALCGGRSRLAFMSSRARLLAKEGAAVSLLCFWPGITPASVRFTGDGFWLHQGGASGRADRAGGPRWHLTAARRMRSELSRIAAQRQFDMIAWCGFGARSGNPTPLRLLDGFGVETR